MRTNIEIDDSLMKEAMELSGAATKKAAVEEALQMLVRIKGQAGILKWFGKIEWEGDLDWARSKDKWQELEAASEKLPKSAKPSVAARAAKKAAA